MESPIIDIFSTKDIEYVLVIAYLTLLVPFWLLLTRTRAVPAVVQAAAAVRDMVAGWFHMPAGYFHHRGHAWAMPDERGLVRVGMDDFAHKLVGTPTALSLPEPGAWVEQGDLGWRVGVGERFVNMLSPVYGQVVAVNQRVLDDPRLAAEDPYGDGWLLQVRPDDGKASFKNLLSGKLARAWMEEVAASLQARMSPELGMVMQDGGTPVAGFARELDPEGWDKLAARFLLSDDLDQGPAA